MRNTQESGQILRSKKRPRRTLRSGRGSRTNSNTSRQIPARVIDATYDTLPPTDFCAETRAQPPIGPVCTENLIRIDCVTESPNVNGDDRALLPLSDPVRLAVQVEEPT